MSTEQPGVCVEKVMKRKGGGGHLCFVSLYNSCKHGFSIRSHTSPDDDDLISALRAFLSPLRLPHRLHQPSSAKYSIYSTDNIK